MSYDVSEMFELVRGTITCASCGRKVIAGTRRLKAVVCQHCGRPYVFIRIKYRGERHFFYQDRHGSPYTYITALTALTSINEQIDKKAFNPEEWTSAHVAARLFENAMERWVERREKDEETGKLAPSTLAGYKMYARLYYLASPHLCGSP